MPFYHTSRHLKRKLEDKFPYPEYEGKIKSIPNKYIELPILANCP